MPFNHNDHYHGVLLRQVPRKGTAALDVGCGTGRFARRLAAVGFDVDAIDSSEDALAQARASSLELPRGRKPKFRQADVSELELPPRHYDYISCVASIHHMPFGTVSKLREALAPGGVLVILGCYPERTRADWAWSLAAVPVNAVSRLVVAVFGKRRLPEVAAPVAPPTMPLAQIRQEAEALLPGCRIRRLLFWRYLLVFRAEDEG